jgi:dGTPase
MAEVRRTQATGKPPEPAAPPAQAARAPFATNPALSRGRLHDEADSKTRTPFERDRDRIVHSSAFRRLKGKIITARG